MRLPIGYALGWPDRAASAFGTLDWSQAAHADVRGARPRGRSAASTWPTRAGRHGGSAPAWLSAANEIAVEAFLDGALPWAAIADVVAETLDAWEDDHVDQVEGVLAADAEARRRAREILARRLGV